jgi:hypothetical protein
MKFSKQEKQYIQAAELAVALIRWNKPFGDTFDYKNLNKIDILVSVKNEHEEAENYEECEIIKNLIDKIN